MAGCNAVDATLDAPVKLHDAGPPLRLDVDAGPMPQGGPCVFLVPEVKERWPRSAALTLEAAARWELDFEIGTPDCRVWLAFNPTVRWARTEANAGRAVIGLNPDAPITDGDECSTDGEWSQRQLWFVDVVTHEFGHVLGLPEAPPAERGCAMCLHHHCEPVHPNADELVAATELHTR